MNLAEQLREHGAPRRPFRRTPAQTSPDTQRSAAKAMEDEKRALVAHAADIAWSGDKVRAAEAREALIAGGSLAIAPLLDVVATVARPEIQDEATIILARVAAGGALLMLLEATLDSNLAPPARSVLARALGQAPLSTEDASRVISVLAGLLADASLEVRDAAASALGDRGGDQAKALLEQALTRETVPLIRDAIRDAIEES